MIIKNEIAKKLRSHAKSEYPHECCGIILGKRTDKHKTAEKIIQTENTANAVSCERYFQIDPLAVLKAELSAEREQLEITGFYHSHPNKAAIPSEQDITNMIVGYSYLIISVENGECTDIRSFERITQTDLDIREEILTKEK